MDSTIRRILLFPSVTRTRILILLGLTVVATLFEGFGVAMLYPIMEFIEKGKDFGALVGTSRMWGWINWTFDLLSVPKNLITLISIVFLLLMLRQYFNYLKSIYSNWITEQIFSDIRSLGFRLFLSSDITFYDSHGTGQMINVLSFDGQRAGSAVFTFFNLLSAVLIFGLYFLLLLALSPGMTLLALIVMVIVGFVLKSRISRSKVIGLEVSRNNEKMSDAIVERLNGIRLVKLSATVDGEASWVRDLSERIKLDSYKLAKIRARMEFVVDPVVIAAGLTILYCSVEIFHMSLAKTGIFIFVLLRLMPYAREVFNSKQALAARTGSLQRVLDLFGEARESQTIKGGSLDQMEIKRGIRFEGVTFGYRPENGCALKNIRVFIPAGKMTALVGRSGAGKSTLVDLIPRLRVPQEGRITIDDVNVEEFDISILRRSIAFVSQEGFLFNDTIENNILYCRKDASQEEMIQASTMAYADPFIREFSEGYKTVVGERGVKLSGGQRQRIILARALLQKALVIILDEPTSSLDSESELYIQQAMDRIRMQKKITMITIAHRLSTIRSADQIIVLDKGQVVESGSHSDLMHEDTWYADMVRMQALG